MKINKNIIIVGILALALVLGAGIYLDIINQQTIQQTNTTGLFSLVGSDVQPPYASWTGPMILQKVKLPSGANRVVDVQLFAGCFSSKQVRIGLSGSVTCDETQWKITKNMWIGGTGWQTPKWFSVWTASELQNVDFSGFSSIYIVVESVYTGTTYPIVFTTSSGNEYADGWYGYYNSGCQCFIGNPCDDSGRDMTFKMTVGEYYEAPVNHPPVCNGVSGPTTGTNGVSVGPFTIAGYDPDGDTLLYKFSWGDGVVSSWLTSSSASHTYTSDGSWNIIAQVKDDEFESAWSSPPHTVVIGGGGNNQAPVCSSVSGPSSGTTSTNCKFTASATDPDVDTLSYFFDWGDSTTSGWLTTSEGYHIWSSTGTYNVKAKAKDPDGLESPYCPTSSITITDGGSTYSITINVRNRSDNTTISGVSVILGSQTVNSDSNGNAIFDGVSSGTKDISIVESGYKDLDTSIDVDESGTYYAFLAPDAESYDSILSDQPWVKEDGDDFLGDWLTLIIILVIGIVISLVLILVPLGPVKYGLIIISWLILIMVYIIFTYFIII